VTDAMQLLARIFALLSECTASDFDRAAAAAGNSSTLASALRHLAEYKREHGQTLPLHSATGAEPSPTSFTKAAAERKGMSVGSSTLPPQLVARLKEVILSTQHFAQTRELIGHLQKSGITARFLQKEGRARILSKVLSEIRKDFPDQRARKLESILSVLPVTNETARWFEVIRRGA
jgi:hypothetical protein